MDNEYTDSGYYKDEIQRSNRLAVVLLLIGFIIGLIAGYLFFALRNDDMEQKYNDHLIEEHSGQHKPT